LFNLPGPRLDPATLLFSTAVMGFVMAAFSFSAARAMPGQRASLRDWGLAMLTSGGAFLLFFMRGHINWTLSFVVGNTLMLAVPVMILKAQSRLVGAPLHRPWLAALCVWSLSGVLLVWALSLTVNLGALTMSSGIAALALMFARLMAFHPLGRTLPAARFSAAVGVLTALTFLWRTWAAATGRLPPINADTQGTSMAHTGSLLAGGLFIAATSITFFTMVHELRRRETADSARRDGLTGLLTRRAFYELAEVLHAEHPAKPVAIAMVDLDHFKAVNDAHGHAGGDHALAHMARLIAGAARNSDLVGRYGGEEFVVLLRDCDAATALRFGERLVELAQRGQVRLPSGEQLRCTLSVGLACRRAVPSTGPAETLDQLINRADRALYAAKASGRNRAAPADIAELAMAASATPQSHTLSSTTA
jgi:diguanylate cyclase (GGDEF)-like protein